MIEERRPYSAREGSSTVGHTVLYITCPFCGVETKAHVWSLAGGGKRCPCGAKHTYMNRDSILRKRSGESND